MTIIRPMFFFDGSCPLCSKEISHYRSLKGSEKLHWVNITRDKSTLNKYSLDAEFAMTRFHVFDAAGQWQTGAYGFVEMWTSLPYYRRLAQIVKALRLLPLLDYFYTKITRWRLFRNCNEKVCKR